MRTRSLVAIALLILGLAPGVARAGDLSRAPVPHALSLPWSLRQIWTDMVSRFTKLWGDSAKTSSVSSPPKGGGVTTDETGCWDPNGRAHCGVAPEASCGLDPNGQPRCGVAPDTSGCWDPNGQQSCGS
jgi:hypothetical protein